MSNNRLAVLVYQTEPPYNKPHMSLKLKSKILAVILILVLDVNTWIIVHGLKWKFVHF